MTIAIVILVISLNLAAHELGHALEMRKNGIKIQEIGIGLPFMSVKIGRSAYFDCPLTFSPVLLGAYVMPADVKMRDIKKLPYGSQAMIYGSGAWMNLWLGIFFFSVAASLGGLNNQGVVFVLAGSALLAPKKIFCRYIFPVLGAIVFALVGYELAYSLIVNHTISEGVGGPVTIVKMADEFKASWSMISIYAAIISISIGIFNAMPIIPLDGGKSIIAIVERYMPKAKKMIIICGALCFATIVVMAISNDIMSFFK